MGIIRDKFWGTGSRATQEEVVELTNQFYVTLRAYFAQVKKTGAAEDVRNKDAIARIKGLLEGHDGEPPVQNWTNAYEVEQLFVHLYDDDTIATELRVRLLEARSILRPELAAMYDATVHDIDNPPAGTLPAATAVRRRSLLARLVNDLQWRYIVNEAKRRYSKLITRRTATLSVLALIVFVGVVMFIATQGGAAFRYSDLRLLWIAALAGTWGATFSMLASLKTRLDQSRFDDLKLMKAGSVLLSRAAIGAGAASILFFFLMSGLLGGTAFPVLTKSEESRQVAAGTTTTPPSATPPSATPPSATPPCATPPSATPPSATPPCATPPSATPPAPAPQAGRPPAAPVQTPTGTTSDTPPARATATATTPQSSAAGKNDLLPTRELAMLIVWCFLAGFSEQLIPGLLASTEARAGVPAQGGTDRFRPTTGTAAVPPVAGGSQQTANTTQTGGAQQTQTPAAKDQEKPKAD